MQPNEDAYQKSGVTCKQRAKGIKLFIVQTKINTLVNPSTQKPIHLARCWILEHIAEAHLVSHTDTLTVLPQLLARHHHRHTALRNKIVREAAQQHTLECGPSPTAEDDKRGFKEVNLYAVRSVMLAGTVACIGSEEKRYSQLR